DAHLGTKELLAQKGDEHMLLAADASLRTKNVKFYMEIYVYKRRADGIYIINPWNLHKVIAHYSRPYGQGDVMRLSPYISAHPLAGRRAQDMFTNHMQKSFIELRVTDSRNIDCQSIKEASLRGHLT
ncbi:hypothetical protein MKX03_027904, partial [Papaver bracteatum]